MNTLQPREPKPTPRKTGNPTESSIRFLEQHTCVVPIDSIFPHEKNVNHADLGALRESFETNGYYGHVVVQKSSRKMLAGNHRHLLAKEMGATEIPVVFIDVDDPTALRILLADNRTTRLGHDDEDALASLLQSIQNDQGSLLGTGFDDGALQELLEELGRDSTAGLTDPDAVPEIPETPVSRPGDLWIPSKDHRVLCGDATKINNILRALDGECADMTFTDPPYGVSYTGKTAQKFYDFLRAACANILTVTTGAVYICMSSSELHTLFRAFTAAGGHWSTFIIWVKNTFTMGRSDYQRQFEAILYGWAEGGPHYWCGDRDQGDVWPIDKPSVNDLHPTMKPVALVERAIRNSSKSKGVVLDPFGGSGSTLLACEITGRRARLIELDPRYVDVIVKRWQNSTGRQAVLEGDGRTFDEIALERKA
jgi:DNA modification methylase